MVTQYAELGDFQAHDYKNLKKTQLIWEYLRVVF